VIAGHQGALARGVGFVLLRAVGDSQHVNAMCDQVGDRLAGNRVAIDNLVLLDGERQLAVRLREVEKVGNAWAKGNLGNLTTSAAVRRHDAVSAGLAQLCLALLGVARAMMKSFSLSARAESVT